MPKSSTSTPSPCKALHGCNGAERSNCSHAQSLEQQHKHLRAQARPSLWERWAFIGYRRTLKFTILPVCAHPEQLKEALEKYT